MHYSTVLFKRLFNTFVLLMFLVLWSVSGWSGVCPVINVLGRCCSGVKCARFCLIMLMVSVYSFISVLDFKCHSA